MGKTDRLILAPITENGLEVQFNGAQYSMNGKKINHIYDLYLYMFWMDGWINQSVSIKYIYSISMSILNMCIYMHTHIYLSFVLCSIQYFSGVNFNTYNFKHCVHETLPG